MAIGNGSVNGDIATRSPNGDEDWSALDVLLDGDIDKVMAKLDRIVEAAPSYRKLISRWENQGWNSETFDFTRDAGSGRRQDLDQEERRFMLLASRSSSSARSG